MKLTEAMVFEYLKQHKEANGLQSLSLNVCDTTGNYAAAFRNGQCQIGKTIIETIDQFPNPKQQAIQMVEAARVKEKEAAGLREEAAKILGEQEPKSFGPDD